MQPVNGLPAVRFNNIRKHNVAQELRVRAAVHGGAHQLRFCKGHTDLLHQLFIPGIVAHAVHHRRHAHTGVVLGVRHHAVIGKLAKGQANGLGNGVGRQPLAGGNNPQQLPVVVLINTMAVHALAPHKFKLAAGDGAGLVKHTHIAAGQGLQMIGALHQNTLPGAGAQPAEEGQGNRNDNGAGTGHHQCRQPTVDPLVPVAAEEQGRDQHQRQRNAAHNGGVNAGKAGDEFFRMAFAVLGVLQRRQHPGHRRVAIGLVYPNGQRAVNGYAAGQHLHTRGNGYRDALAGKGGGVHLRIALQHRTVQVDLLPRLHHNGLARLHRLRRRLRQTVFRLYPHGVRLLLQHTFNGSAALLHRQALQKFAHGIKQHHGAALRILPNGKGAQRRHRH